ncbi:MAG: hypothetical protein UR89_C0021G0014 [Candidatus Roizmanbacteria bacterium GW2011_GWA2_35_8]|uniref:FAD-binding FR-type domain-containing protein n=1 Tax=Candidatus Roizmanbacteria bacterium GW2011_GWA2_35_8 TaxID=1618479 RepID=A0A0G0G450_9BACT|nr:MAG: hypothetical protein UR89_C0021G0014 [Candidatus Roizmanbacteria bacterium GW2011_GWA2_35_8]
MLTHYKTILTSKKQLVNNIYLFTFKLTDPSEINFIPGQYVILKVPKDGAYISRLYSIASSSQTKDTLELLVEIIPNGLGSNYLDKLKINTEVIFQGPAGMFKLRDSNKQKVFLVTGTGIAPILSIIKSNFQFSNFQLFWGLKNYQDVYLLEELKKYNIKICLSREKNLLMIPEADRQYFNLGHVNLCFDKLATSHQSPVINFEFYLCGERNIVESLRQRLQVKNVLPENIIFEKF